MSTDFASSRVFPDPLSYKLRVDCEREIDFDFFDDAPSVPTTPSWGQGAPREVPDAGVDGVLDLGPGNVPSPMLVGGPTPADSSGSSGLSSAVSLAASLNEDGRQIRAGPARSFSPTEDAVEEVLDDSEVLHEHGDDDVVVAVVACSGAAQSAATPPPCEQQQAQVHDSAAVQPLGGAGGDTGDRVLDVDAGGKASTASSPNHSTASTTSSVSEDSDDSDYGDGGAGDGGGDAAESAAEDACFGIQELSLTVSTKPHRASSSTLTVSSMTAVSSVAREDSAAGDSEPEDAYTMAAIKKALCRSRRRPPSSTGSLPLPAMAASARPARPRRLNMSFSNDDARRIQRENELLLRRIVGQRARQPQLGPAAPRPAPAPVPPPPHRCSHAVNRARRGKDIERDNQILLKKIQTVKRSPSQLSVSRSSSSMSGRYSYG